MSARAAKVIPLRLDSRVPAERALQLRYDSLPRARRQEWLRSVVLLGVRALGDAPLASEQLAAATPAAQPASAEVARPAEPAHFGATERSTSPSAVSGESARSALDGFF